MVLRLPIRSALNSGFWSATRVSTSCAPIGCCSVMVIWTRSVTWGSGASSDVPPPHFSPGRLSPATFTEKVPKVPSWAVPLLLSRWFSCVYIFILCDMYLFFLASLVIYP